MVISLRSDNTYSVKIKKRVRDDHGGSVDYSLHLGSFRQGGVCMWEGLGFVL